MKEVNAKFETALNRLNEIADTVENSELSLEETLALYKEGLKLSKSCEAMLGKFEKEITVLQKEADGLFTQTVISSSPQYNPQSE